MYKPFWGYYYAHRGLHDNKGMAPENSMAAFVNAVEAGYGIELDVQLTKDEIPVVFHDESLKRACARTGNVREYTYEELRQFPLFASKEHIPLLYDVLKLVNGQVPLIIEIKSYENAEKVCQIADGFLRRYKGAYCIESFHPLAVMWYKVHRPEVARGQLSTNFRKQFNREPFARFLVHHLFINMLSRPDFIAYNHKYKNNLSRLICRHLFRALSIAWTIRSQQELNQCRNEFDLFIFEGFLPEE